MDMDTIEFGLKDITKNELYEKIINLYHENLKLQDTIKRLEEKIENTNLSLSLEETIEAFRAMNEQEKQEINPFAALFGSTNNASEGVADTKINPDEFSTDMDIFVDDINISDDDR